MRPHRDGQQRRPQSENLLKTLGSNCIQEPQPRSRVSASRNTQRTVPHLTKMRNAERPTLAETTIWWPSGLQNGCCQFPRVVIARASVPSAAASQTWKEPVASSAERASVPPSGDHQGLPAFAGPVRDPPST
jgi:hypothetical protein